MSASVTNDNLTESMDGGNPIVTTVSSSRSIGGSSLSVVALTNWPTDTAVYFVTYKKLADGSKDFSSQVSWKAIVSGSTLGTLTLVDGEDAGNDPGDYVEMGPTAGWAQGLYEFGTKEHSSQGVHDATKVAMLAGTQTITGNKTFTGSVTLPDDTVTPDQRTGGFAAGTVTPSATGSKAVTGLGFKPKKVEFFLLPTTASGNIINGYGVMTATSEFAHATNASSGTAMVTYSSSSNCTAYVGSGSTTPTQLASFVSMDSDGFTINFSAQTGIPVGWIATA